MRINKPMTVSLSPLVRARLDGLSQETGYTASRVVSLLVLAALPDGLRELYRKSRLPAKKGRDR